MRLPRLIFKRPSLRWPALVAIGAAVPPAALHAALASAAGTLFEAAPFVLAAEVLPRRHAWALDMAGCGCGRRRLPGALAIPAFALCWLSFGPLVALARAAAGAAVFRLRRERSRGGPLEAGKPDTFSELSSLIIPTILAALVAQALGAHSGGFPRAVQPLAFLAGACIGVLVPCAKAGVAMAAALVHPLPAAATGLLATAGLIRPLSQAGISRRSMARPAPTAHAGFASVGLAFALAAIVWRGPAGLVNPRLLPFDAAGAILAFCAMKTRRTASRAAPLLGAGLVAALAAGYALPETLASETTIGGAYPGERVVFTGVAHGTAPVTTLQRFAIACCRLDATPVALRLTRRLPVSDGTWMTVQGTFVREREQLLVRPERWETVPAPADPFVYR